MSQQQNLQSDSESRELEIALKIESWPTLRYYNGIKSVI